MFMPFFCSRQQQYQTKKSGRKQVWRRAEEDVFARTLIFGVIRVAVTLKWIFK